MLTIATAAEQRARDALTAAVWGGGLSTAQFLEREQRLRAHPWAAATMTTWLWRDEAGAVLASCESFLDQAHAGSRSGTAATIASVFTEPHLRGQGHAGAMLRAVVQRLRGDPRCLAVTLFSEIGTELYQRLGFWPVPAFDTFFPARPDAPSGVSWVQAPLPSPVHPEGDPHTLRLALSSSRLDWQLERERVYGAAMGRGPLTHHGARVGESTITWTAYWKTDELQVLSLDAREPSHLPALLHAAGYAAHACGLSVVRVWETRDLSGLPGAQRLERTDEIAMFLPLLPGVQGWTMVERGLWA